jgi:hypothetical protein
MAALAIFQPWIWVGVGIGKLLIDLGGKIFLTQICMVWERANFWLSVSLCYSYRLNAVMD